MKKSTFQLIYIFTFIIMLIGIAGNIELSKSIPIWMYIVTAITGFLTIGKFIYIYFEGGER